MRFYSALKAELERVDAGNWEEKLDALHGQHGTWDATAEALGVHRRTVERWRKGYQPRKRRDGTQPPRQRVDPDTFTGKIRDALGADRRAQVSAVDWSALIIVGTIVIEGYEDQERHEKMYVGRYLSAGSISGIGAAYVARSPVRVQRAIDHAMSADYIGQKTHLKDVDPGGLSF